MALDGQHGSCGRVVWVEICLPTASKAALLLSRLMSRAFVDECTHLLAVKTKPTEKAVLIL